MSQLPQGRYAFTAQTLGDLVQQLNVFAERLQVGGLVQAGLKLAIRDAAPTEAPAAGTPNLVVVSVAGVVKFYAYDGSAWVVVGTQS